MPDQPVRHYHCKDVDMLTVASTLIGNAIANKTFLQSKRSTWADPFFDNLSKQIDTTTQTYLGADNAQSLRNETITLYSIKDSALSDLGELKIQLEEDFKGTPTTLNEILIELGYHDYYVKAYHGDEQSLVQLLFRFNTNMTPALQTQITTLGTDPTTITNILGYATTLNAANITQETFKASRKEATAEGITAFNAIYDAVISVGRISAKFYEGQPAMEQQFEFTVLLRNLSSGHKTTEKKPVTPIPPVKG
jgi:hypothetical protein